MFKCVKCGKNSKLGEKSVMVTLLKRRRNYPARTNEFGEVIDNGGQGWETETEGLMHAACAKELAVS